MIEDERRQYFEDNRKRQNDEDDVGILAAAGGEVKVQEQEHQIQFLLDYQTESL